MLKICILFVVLTAFVALATCAPQSQPDFEAKCQSEFNVTHEEMEHLHQTIKDSNDEVDRKFKCFTKCLLDAFDYIDANGDIDLQKVLNRSNGRNLNDLNRTIKVATECKEKFEIEEDKCEYPFKVMVCVTLRMRELREEENEKTPKKV